MGGAQFAQSLSQPTHEHDGIVRVEPQMRIERSCVIVIVVPAVGVVLVFVVVRMLTMLMVVGVVIVIGMCGIVPIMSFRLAVLFSRFATGHASWQAPDAIHRQHGQPALGMCAGAMRARQRHLQFRPYPYHQIGLIQCPSLRRPH